MSPEEALRSRRVVGLALGLVVCLIALEAAAVLGWVLPRLSFEGRGADPLGAVEIVGSAGAPADEYFSALEKSLLAGRFEGGGMPGTGDGRAMAPPEFAPLNDGLEGEASPLVLPEYDPAAIVDPSAAQLVEEAVALRGEGDTAGALDGFQRALVLVPSHPRVLYEMARTYEAMGLADKAADYWEKVYALGELAGELYHAADFRLRGGTGEGDGFIDRPVSIAGVQTVPDHSAAGGERVSLQLMLRNRPGSTIDHQNVEAHVFFFDLVDGAEVDVTTADPPVAQWLTGPAIDWADGGEEILEVVYFQPSLTAAEEAEFGRRRYYGHVVNLYYDNRLVDKVAEPRTLFDYMAQRPAPLLDDTLFRPQ